MITTTRCGNKLVKNFTTRFITMNGSQQYELIGGTIQGSKFLHTVKNSAGEYRDFEHEELIRLVEKG